MKTTVNRLYTVEIKLIIAAKNGKSSGSGRGDKSFIIFLGQNLTVLFRHFESVSIMTFSYKEDIIVIENNKIYISS